jgi:hypothetical protein
MILINWPVRPPERAARPFSDPVAAPRPPKRSRQRAPGCRKSRQRRCLPGCRVMPCCFDALSARLVEQAGFPLTFMSGFAVSAARAALPDTGLLSVSEMLDQGRSICEAVSIPVIGDGDTGHGNAVNVHRTVAQFARAGFAGHHDRGPAGAEALRPHRREGGGERDEAERRIRAAVAARDAGADLVIIARTDARSALERPRAGACAGRGHRPAQGLPRPGRRRTVPGGPADRGRDGPLLPRGARACTWRICWRAASRRCCRRSGLRNSATESRPIR